MSSPPATAERLVLAGCYRLWRNRRSYRYHDGEEPSRSDRGEHHGAASQWRRYASYVAEDIVTKRMNRGALVNAALFEVCAEGVLHAALRHGLGCFRQVDMAATFGGKDQRWITMRGPVVAQQFERALGQWNITILVALAMADMDHHPRAVDVRNCEADAFLQTESAGIDGRETDAVAQ